MRSTALLKSCKSKLISSLSSQTLHSNNLSAIPIHSSKQWFGREVTVPSLCRNYSVFKNSQQQYCNSCKREFHTNLNLNKQKNPYEVMNLSKDASKDEIKKRFKELAKKYHPDVNKEPDAKEKFAELNNAYQILVDDDKRRIYDQTGNPDAASQGDPFAGQEGGFGSDRAEEIFRSFFGRGGPFGGDFRSAFGGEDMFGGFGGDPRRGPEVGDNVRRVVNVSLKEAVMGTSREIQVNKASKCNTCDGTGENNKSKAKTCQQCGGTGRLTMRQGFFVMETTCNACGGMGKMKDPCGACNGKGHTREQKTYEFKVPEGTEDGAILRMKECGEPGFKGGPPGDLLLEIRVATDPVFRRKGNTLEVDADINVSQAILGGKINVPTIQGGDAEVNIASGTQNGDSAVVKGKGVKNAKSKAQGDLVVNFKVKIPKQITEEQRKIIEDFAKTENNENYSHCSTKSSFWKNFGFGRK